MDSASTVHLRRLAVKVKESNINGIREEEELETSEPLSPFGRLFHQPSLNCCILIIIGFKKEIDVDVAIAGLEATLLKHKRFSSIVKEDDRGNLIWVPTRVNLESHIISPQVEFTEPDFVENYAAKLETAPPLHPSKPLWEIHLLNAKSEEAASSVVLRIHHSLGDGVSLMSFLLACARKVTDPESLPTVPRHLTSKGRDRGITWALAALWEFLLFIWYTVFDVMHFFATAMGLQDSDTPLKGSPGVESCPKRLAYVTVNWEDIKSVKNAVNCTVNDVMLAMISAGLVRYLDRRYAENEGSEKSTYIGKKLLVRSLVVVNTRPAPGLQEHADMMKVGTRAKWGHDLGYAIIPFAIVKHSNPLNYVRAANLMFRKKKLSWEAPFTQASSNLLQKLRGVKAATSLLYDILSRTTFTFSNMAGPVEEVQLFGHPVTHIVPTVSGFPQSLMIHFQSYNGTGTLVVKTAEDVIPDPKQLCRDCVDALHRMRQAAAADQTVK
eukprot:Gb_01171 [translate_table: standard]